ncbi:MAG TPA: ATP synthase F0 subunit B, partial [Terriglobales bacterium]|nr:ATP synthase F0 subunit B [Terriglobales bacterium]
SRHSASGYGGAKPGSWRPVMMHKPKTRSALMRVLLLSAVGAILLVSVLLSGSASAQENSSEPAPTQQKSASQQKAAAQGGENSGSSFGRELAEASREAAGEKEENAQFKFSPSVRWMGKELGIGVHGAYWLAFILNFAVLALVIYLLSRSRIPAMFRSRTATIRRAMEEAGKASAEANRRLGEIEARLARLDQEIAAMHQQAEEEAASEEEKLRLAAAQDARRVVEGAEQEIAAAASLARRELKAYAAELSVAMAEKRIHVDKDTDAALVRDFADQLGDGMRGPHRNGGKDGR